MPLRLRSGALRSGLGLASRRAGGRAALLGSDEAWCFNLVAHGEAVEVEEARAVLLEVGVGTRLARRVEERAARRARRVGRHRVEDGVVRERGVLEVEREG